MRQNRKIQGFVLLVVFLLAGSGLHANNIEVGNISLTGQNSTDGYTLVQFDLSWDNSWREDTVNHDAAWVFVKYSIDNGVTWYHASLDEAGHTAPDGSTIDVGLKTVGSTFDASTNPGVGVFIYRSADGIGTFSLSGVQLQWNYADNGVSDDAQVLVKVFAVEMVYVPEGAYYLGSGGSETGHFYTYNGSTTTTPYQVTSSSSQITVGTTAGNLYYNSSYGALGSISATFPNGYAAFYCMKFEVSQGQYAAFLNTLTSTQRTNRYYSTTSYRYTITLDDTCSVTSPDIACNYLSWIDDAAYADWAGLRPMTELEYEKACRGTKDPVSSEYAWGTPSAASTVYTLENSGTSTEGIATNYIVSSRVGNCACSDTWTTGPLRVGIFAANEDNYSRLTAGATYYGAREMSGNLWERTVTVGNSTGLAFTGTHGDGTLTTAGYATNTDWPGYTSGTGVSAATGIGSRGGAYDLSAPDYARVSCRVKAVDGDATRAADFGFRAARTAP